MNDYESVREQYISTLFPHPPYNIFGTPFFLLVSTSPVIPNLSCTVPVYLGMHQPYGDT